MPSAYLEQAFAIDLLAGGAHRLGYRLKERLDLALTDRADRRVTAVLRYLEDTQHRN